MLTSGTALRILGGLQVREAAPSPGGGRMALGRRRRPVPEWQRCRFPSRRLSARVPLAALVLDS